MRTVILLACTFCLLSTVLLAATLSSTDSDSGMEELPHLRPGMHIILPDGVNAHIEKVLKNGNFITSFGQEISPLGIILNGEFKDFPVSIEVEENVVLMAAEAKNKEQSEEKAGRQTTGIQENTSRNKRAEAESVKSSESGAGKKEEFDLEQLLAFSENEKYEKKRKKAETADTSHQKKAETKARTETRQAEEKRPVVKVEKESAAKEKHDRENKANTKAENGKVPVGKPLRIPPDAIKTGNLSFLEGCWEGTRPEYYTKRIVKECFCFSAGGKYGKRRINDTAYGGRQCIGATHATLSGSGVLSVTSQSMACSDGAHWGAAMMTCRNSGPSTPCSWIFTDARNGRQAYIIPFIRVESCRR